VIHIHASQIVFGLGYVALAFIAGCVVGAWERWGPSRRRAQELVALNAPEYRWQGPDEPVGRS
jgi:hypothetical protein